jgi:4-hydroxybenzoate polyprenyltransferase
MVVGMYIAGVTWFARTEARESSVTALRGAAGVMLGALVLSLAVPSLFREQAPGQSINPLFPYFLVGFIFFVGQPVSSALARPLPERVQAAVKRAVLGLVLLDAILATALAGWVGVLVALLLVPANWLGRWVYST